MQQESSQLERTQPYLLKLGTNIFLIADGCATIIKPSSLAVGLDVLLKSYFVFNVTYPKQVVVLLNFLQHALLGLTCDQLTAKSQKMISELQKA